MALRINETLEAFIDKIIANKEIMRCKNMKKKLEL